ADAAVGIVAGHRRRVTLELADDRVVRRRLTVDVDRRALRLDVELRRARGRACQQALDVRLELANLAGGVGTRRRDAVAPCRGRLGCPTDVRTCELIVL